MTLDEMVSNRYESLNESDLHIWRYVSAHRGECSRMTIEELGKKCNVSRTTILRFSKKLNLEGYSELKYYLRNEATTVELTESSLIDLDSLLKNYMVMLADLQNKSFERVSEMIENASRIVVVATGTVQRLVAQELQRCFLRLGILMTVVTGRTEIERISYWIREDDLVFMISLSGESREIVELARKLHAKGNSTISITRLASNTVSKLADEPIYVFSDGIPIEGSSLYMSTTMFFSVIEIMFIKYFNYLKSKEIKGDS